MSTNTTFSPLHKAGDAPWSSSPRARTCTANRERTSAFALEPVETDYIYAVDDEPWLTHLYTVILCRRGYNVRAFNHRAEALAALKGERKKPDLLILDYSGHAMPAETFMQGCLQAHPALRILMASGFHELDAHLSSVRPDRFLQKPFTAETFLREVQAALGA